MAYNGGGLEDPQQNWPFSVRYTASPYRKSKFPVVDPDNNHHPSSASPSSTTPHWPPNGPAGTTTTTANPAMYTNGQQAHHPTTNNHLNNNNNLSHHQQHHNHHHPHHRSLINAGPSFVPAASTNMNGFGSNSHQPNVVAGPLSPSSVSSAGSRPLAHHLHPSSSSSYPFGYLNSSGPSSHLPHQQHLSSMPPSDTSVHSSPSNNLFQQQQHHPQQQQHFHQHPALHNVNVKRELLNQFARNSQPAPVPSSSGSSSANGQQHQQQQHFRAIQDYNSHYGLPAPISAGNGQCQLFIRYPRRKAGFNDPNSHNQVEPNILDEGYIEDLKQPYTNRNDSVTAAGPDAPDYDPYSYVYDSKIRQDFTVKGVKCCPSTLNHLPLSSATLSSITSFSSNTNNMTRIEGPSPSGVAGKSACANNSINHLSSPKMSATTINSASPRNNNTSATENEYEEIRDVARYMNSSGPGPLHFKSFSSTDDILAEVVQVQQRHDRVLDQLNLEVENLLISSTHEVEQSVESASAEINGKYPLLHPPQPGQLDKMSSLSLNGIYTECYCDEIPSLPQFGGTLNILRGVQQQHVNLDSSNCCAGSGYTMGEPPPQCCCANPPPSTISSANDAANGSFLRNKRSHSLIFNNQNGFFPHHPPSGANPTGNNNNAKNSLFLQNGVMTAASGAVSEFDLTSASTATAYSTSNNNTFGRKKKIERHSIHFHQQTQHQLNDIDPKKQINAHLLQHYHNLNHRHHILSVPLAEGKNCKNRHHRSYSLIPHWKIREHLRRLPFLRQQHKLKKTEGTSANLPSSTIPISSSGQDFTSNKKMNDVTTTTTTSSPNKSVNSARRRSCSMDELRATGPDEHWYSADSDTEPDSLTAIPEPGQNGKNGTSLGNIINTVVSNSTTNLHSPVIENGSLKSELGNGILEAPKAPKFRRGTGLKDKWRESWGSAKGGKAMSEDDNRLLRWFSLRKSETSLENAGTKQQNSSATLPNLTEEEINTDGYWPRRTVQPPKLPELSQEQISKLTPDQLTRRQIVAAIVYSENNYLSSLQRLVNMMVQLRQSHPAILSHAKISSIFHRVSEIFQCHSLFRIALADCVRKWDTEEKMGDVFVASFSKSLVLDVYSEFINNFGLAMETAKVEARRKSAFADFLKVQLHLHSDRLSLFGLMVKPVQRFPQFILLLQDLLKHTPKDHHDRMSLQLALTQLESLAAMLNERKRESEQYQEFVKQMKSIGGKFGLSRNVADDPNRILLRQDIVTQVDFDSGGVSVAKAKTRKLLLLNDMLICVALSQNSTDQQSSHHLPNQPSTDDKGSGSKAEKSVFKWSKHLRDIDVEDIAISPTMSRFVQSSIDKRATLKANSTGSTGNSTTSSSPATNVPDEVELLEEMQSLMHDYEVFSRMLTLSSTLKSQYDGFTPEAIKETMLEIQHQIRRRDEQISYFDSSFLTLLVGGEKMVFQMQSPTARNDWIEELKLAQLALDSNNSPGWDIPESPYTSQKIPLFVRSLPIKAQNVATVKSGCYFTHTIVGPTGRSKIYDLLYICTSDGFSSHVKAYRSQQNALKEVSSFDFDLVEEKVNELLFVSGFIWLATESRKIMLFDPSDPATGPVNSYFLSDSVLKLTFYDGCVYAGLADGNLAIFGELTQAPNMKPPELVKLGDHKIQAVFGSRDFIYAACGSAVVHVDAKTHKVEKSVVLNQQLGPIAHMACSGVGLWIVPENSDTVCLYHLESLQHLQDVSIAPSVFRTVRDTLGRQKGCHVTCLAAHKGWLWIGSNLGVILTIPLPRLEGVPIINTGKANVSYHGYTGPVTFLMPLIKPTVAALPAPRPKITRQAEFEVPPTSTKTMPPLVDPGTDSASNASSKSSSINFEEVNHSKDSFKEILESTKSPPLARTDSKEGSPRVLSSSSLSRTNSDTGSTGEPCSVNQRALVVLRKKNSRDSVFNRNCKTLPRGGAPLSLRFSLDSDVYGLYGNLINVRGLEDEGFVDPLFDALRRSDPELNTMDSKANTLDRRLKMRLSRPRSLDLSNWSVDSKVSASSDESVGLRNNILNNGGIPQNGQLQASSPSPALATPEPTSNQDSANVRNAGTVKKTLGSRAKKPKNPGTVVVVVGGRGYINIRNSTAMDHSLALGADSSSNPKHDAHLIVWQMKT